jgi:Sugar kinases, ribokinase family
MGMLNLVRVLGYGDNVVDKYEHIRTMFPGGNCVNFSVYAKQCGADSSAYMGIFGNDCEAEHVIETLKNIGVETYKCRQVDGENGCARVTISEGDRKFLGSNKGGVRKTIKYILDRFDLEYIKTFDMVHSGNYSYTETELGKIKKIGVPVSFDFSHDTPNEYFALVAPNVDYAFMSCSNLDDEAIRNLLKMVTGYGCKIAVATMGSRGCIAFNGEHYFYQEAIPVDVIDTMGAGDSLITSFMVGYIDKMKQGLRENEAIIKKCLLEASQFAIKTCLVEGSFGYGKKY